MLDPIHVRGSHESSYGHTQSSTLVSLFVQIQKKKNYNPGHFRQVSKLFPARGVICAKERRPDGYKDLWSSNKCCSPGILRRQHTENMPGKLARSLDMVGTTKV